MEDILQLVISVSTIFVKVSFKRVNIYYYKYTKKYLSKLNYYTAEEIGKLCDEDFIKFALRVGINMRAITLGLYKSNRIKIQPFSIVYGYNVDMRSHAVNVVKIASKRGDIGTLKMFIEYLCIAVRYSLSTDDLTSYNFIKSIYPDINTYILYHGVRKITLKNYKLIRNMLNDKHFDISFESIIEDLLDYLIEIKYDFKDLDVTAAALNKNPVILKKILNIRGIDGIVPLYDILSSHIDNIKLLVSLGYNKTFDIIPKNATLEIIKYAHEVGLINKNISANAKCDIEILKYLNDNGIHNIHGISYDLYEMYPKKYPLISYNLGDIGSISDYRLHRLKYRNIN